MSYYVSCDIHNPCINAPSVSDRLAAAGIFGIVGRRVTVDDRTQELGRLRLGPRGETIAASTWTGKIAALRQWEEHVGILTPIKHVSRAMAAS